MKRYAVALYFEKSTSRRLYQAVLRATDECHAIGIAYKDAKKKLLDYNLVLEIVTVIKQEGGE